METAGGETVGIVLQNRPSPDPRTFIGEGKVAEVQLYCENTGATMVIFDNDLSPSQMRVLTELLGVQVNLQCWVKVREDWRDNEQLLNSLGFAKP